jgi:hypothetical protein
MERMSIEFKEKFTSRRIPDIQWNGYEQVRDARLFVRKAILSIRQPLI